MQVKRLWFLRPKCLWTLCNVTLNSERVLRLVTEKHKKIIYFLYVFAAVTLNLHKERTLTILLFKVNVFKFPFNRRYYHCVLSV